MNKKERDQDMSNKNTATAKKIAPKMTTRTDLPVTDPRRKLSREEWKDLSKEQKAERKQARQAARGPIKARMVKIVLKLAARAERLSRAFDAEKPIQEALLENAKTFRLISSDVDELADGWVPSGRKVQHSFKVGDRVVMVQAQIANYENLLGDDLGELEVMNAVGKRVVCKTVKGGVRLFLPAKHIMAVS